jgi:SAM-dependent methyltransferase
MDTWDQVKQRCISDIIANIPLTPGAYVLDYGCGSGFFTRLLRKLLPQVHLVGVDLSPTAIRLAKDRDPNSAYFVLGDSELEAMRGSFDLIFSHHVLEHVVELDKVASDLASFSAQNGRMLHILPCANPGSFEFEICSLYPDGIDPARGNRFFCEDPSHLRRMSAQDIVNLFGRVGFFPGDQYFMNQYWGALNWISEASPDFIQQIFDYRRRDAAKRDRLFFYNKLCSVLVLLRYSHRINIREKFINVRSMPLRQATTSLIKGMIAGIAYPMAWLTNWMMVRLAIREWDQRRHTANGSEMAVLFQRTSPSA